jgi:ferredoxin
MGIHIQEKNSVLDTRCNKCGNCLRACHSEEAISFSLPRKPSLKLKNSLVTGVLILVLFAAPILVAQARGLFKTSNKPVITRGELLVHDVKGSMTLDELAKGFDMNVDTLLTVLGIPPDVPESTKIFDLEDINESITINTVKMELSKYLSEG